MAVLFNIPANAFHEVLAAPRLTALIIGHNSVVNLEWFGALKTAQEGLSAYVTAGSVTQAALHAQWLEVDILFKEVHYEYLSKVTDDVIEGVEETVEYLRPNVVILDLITNDLAEVHQERSAYDVGASIFDFAHRLKHDYGVQVIDIFSCLRRTRDMNCSPEEFSDRMVDCHDAIRVPCLFNFNIDFIRLSGFQRYRNRQQMAVAYYSDNGVTPAPSFTSYGFKKYKKNVRQALQSAVPKWVMGHRLGLY